MYIYLYSRLEDRVIEVQYDVKESEDGKVEKTWKREERDINMGSYMYFLSLICIQDSI